MSDSPDAPRTVRPDCPECGDGGLVLNDAIYARCDDCGGLVLRDEVKI